MTRPPNTLLCCLAAVALSASCQQNTDRVVVEVILTGFTPAAELDRLEVTVAASATAQGDSLCQPYTDVFAVRAEDATELPLATFPLRIAYKSGSHYDKILFVRVLGLRAGTVRLKSERMVSLQGGNVQLRVELPVECIGEGTGTGRHCVDGLVQESPYGEIFDDLLYVEPSAESCVVE